MALSEEELKLQLDILATRTDQNPDMAFKTNATLNKGLNPDYFSGQNTKIVNAINSLALSSAQTNESVKNIADKVNEILLDTSIDANAVIWENVKDLMDSETIIEGIEKILQGQQVDKILDLDVADKGKVLSVDVDENGKAILKAIDMIASEPQDLTALNVSYTNSKVPTVKNVKTALDNIFTQLANGNTGGGDGEFEGGVVVGDITWDMIVDRPQVPNKLQLVSNRLALVDEDGIILSSVNMMTDAEVDSLIEEIKNNTEEE